MGLVVCVLEENISHCCTKHAQDTAMDEKLGMAEKLERKVGPHPGLGDLKARDSRGLQVVWEHGDSHMCP